MTVFPKRLCTSTEPLSNEAEFDILGNEPGGLGQQKPPEADCHLKFVLSIFMFVSLFKQTKNIMIV